MIRKFGVALASLELFLGLSFLIASYLAVGALAGAKQAYSHPAFLSLSAFWVLNLAACTIRKRARLPGPVLVVHLAVMVIVAGGAVTWKAGKRGKLILESGTDPVRTVLDDEGVPKFDLPFAVRLDHFRVELDGEDLHRLTLSDPKEGKEWTLDVKPGGVHEVPGTPWTLVVGRFVPDLVVGDRGVETRSKEPRNPALQVAFLEDGKPRGGSWLFAFHPGMHQEDLPLEAVYEYRPAPVKQYVSRVAILDGTGSGRRTGELWVNRPLRHAGWTLYQSGYDPEDEKISILEAARDPGVPLVYGGFALLMAGLTAGFLRRRA